MLPIRQTSRLYINDDLNANAAIACSAEQAHYLKNVMRLKEKDVLRVFNGRDGEWRGSIGEYGKHGARITVHEQLRPQAQESDLRLCCAPIKKAHFEYTIEKTTELGIRSIQPVLTARTQIREVNPDRCRVIAIEAAEQSERLSVPDVEKAIPLKKLAEDWPKDRLPVVCAEWGDALPVHEAFAGPELKNETKVTFLTGPEGGFASEELEMLKKIPGALFVRLGPRILRADTAAIAAIACWQAQRGDWA